MVPPLTEVFVLRETAGNIVRLLKLDPEVARTFQELYGKHDFTMACIFKNDGMKDARDFEEWCDRRGDNREPGELQDRIVAALNRNPQLSSQLRKLTLQQAIELVQSAKKKDYAGKEIIKFPDGFYWAKVEDCGEEGELMQHCGQGHGDMYSLRDPSNMPHVTMDVVDWGFRNARGEQVIKVDQVKGKQNASPDRKYWDYIPPLMDKLGAQVAGGTDSGHDKEFKKFLLAIK